MNKLEESLEFVNTKLKEKLTLLSLIRICNYIVTQKPKSLIATDMNLSKNELSLIIDEFGLYEPSDCHKLISKLESMIVKSSGIKTQMISKELNQVGEVKTTEKKRGRKPKIKDNTND